MRCLPLASSTVTGANGEPLAKITRPSVHLYACSAVHSDRCVGFDMAKMLQPAQQQEGLGGVERLSKEQRSGKTNGRTE